MCIFTSKLSAPVIIPLTRFLPQTLFFWGPHFYFFFTFIHNFYFILFINSAFLLSYLATDLFCFLFNRWWLIGLVSLVFANGPEDLGSILGRVVPKTLKMVLDTSLLNTQQYKVRTKGKVEQSRERSSAPLHLGAVAIEKGAFSHPRLKGDIFT